MNQSLAEMSSSDFEAEDEDEFCEQPKNESSDASEKESPRRSDESPVKHLSKKVKIEENSENQIFGLGNSVVIEIPETVVEGMTETTEMLACESLKQRDSSSLIINQSSVNESSSTKNLIEMKESSIDESSTIIDQSSSILNSPENNKILKITDFYKSK